MSGFYKLGTLPVTSIRNQDDTWHSLNIGATPGNWPKEFATNKLWVGRSYGRHDLTLHDLGSSLHGGGLGRMSYEKDGRDVADIYGLEK